MRAAGVFLSIAMIFAVHGVVAQETRPRSVSAAPELTRMMREPIIQEDLDLTDAQLYAINQLHKLRTERMAATIDQIRRLENAEDRRKAHNEMLAESKRDDEGVKGILSPSQLRRLDQILMQYVAQPNMPAAGLMHPSVAEKLNISDFQRDQIRSKVSEVEGKLKVRLEELRKEANELRVQARNDVLRLLDEEQRRKYSELFGNILSQ